MPEHSFKPIGDVWTTDQREPMEAIRRLFDIQQQQTVLFKQEDLLEQAVAMLARSAELYDNDTGDHIKRMGAYSSLFARLLGADVQYQKAIGIQAQLHDVGKVHIASDLLKKPGRLSDDEFDMIKRHTINGGRIIGERNQDFALAHQIALYHHEKWDGSGYPYGLKGEEIPFAARIVSIVDIFDALVSRRSYKPAFSYDTAYQIMKEGDPERNFKPECAFDPTLFAVFIDHFEDFMAIHKDNLIRERALAERLMKVIVLDDDPMIHRQIELMLGHLNGVEVYSFNCIQAMKNALTNETLNPYLFFVDINLPDGTGHEAAREIKARFPNAYLVCITADDNVNRNDLFLYDRIFHKPIELNNLAEITETIIHYGFRPLLAETLTDDQVHAEMAYSYVR